MGKKYLTTKEIAEFLDINEKMVYQLINEKGLPACKVTGKWLFPRHLVDVWIENNTVNRPSPAQNLIHSVIIVMGSHDPLLESLISLYNKNYPDHPIVYSHSGSIFGLQGLKKGICHIAASHLIQEDEIEYNFEYLKEFFGEDVPAVVNFCYREQGIIVKKGNPKKIKNIGSFAKKDITIANRPKGTGTRLLLDHELKKAGIDPSQINGYDNEFFSHVEVGIEVLSGRADAGIGIKAVASMLGLDFISLRWERYDLLIPKPFFFERNLQQFLGMLQEREFKRLAERLDGYDIKDAGRLLFPHD